MAPTRKPLVLIPQWFGCLIFDRRTSRYLPFDREASNLLRQLSQEPIDTVLAQLPSRMDQEAVERFVDCFYERGFFTLAGRLAAEVLDIDVPADHLAGPLAVHLEIVAACNLTCKHCFAGVLPRNHNPLSLPELHVLFHDLARMGSFRLGLTGGEPLLRKDLFDILDAATEQGLHPCLTTNGMLITEESAREFGRRKLVWLNVSLEGPDAETNDAIRGHGTFAKVINNLRLLRRHARFTLAFTVLRTNAHLVQQCAKLACQVGAHTAVFRPLYPVGIAKKHPELMPSFAQYAGALRELAGMDRQDADLTELDPFGPEQRAPTQPQIHTSHTCGAGNHVCSISVQGDVNPCSFLGTAFNGGNLRETPFPILWRTSRQFARMRRQPSNGCEGGFQGGCRARAQTLAGSVDAPDPWYEQYLLSKHRAEGSLHPASNLEVISER
jgi:radical SAM protein with 4Fe4S-binding SPASM domain